MRQVQMTQAETLEYNAIHQPMLSHASKLILGLVPNMPHKSIRKLRRLAGKARKGILDITKDCLEYE